MASVVSSSVSVPSALRVFGSQGGCVEEEGDVDDEEGFGGAEGDGADEEFSV